MTQNPDPNRAREALLQHYSSQLRGHGWYLLTAVVAIFTGMQTSLKLAKSSPCFAILVFSLSVGFGLAFTLHSFGRILYYGESCRAIIDGDMSGLTELQQLSREVRKYIRNRCQIFDILFCGGLQQLLVPAALTIVISAWAYILALNIFK